MHNTLLVELTAAIAAGTVGGIVWYKIMRRVRARLKDEGGARD